MKKMADKVLKWSDPTEIENIKKRCQNIKGDQVKKELHRTPDNRFDGVILFRAR